MGYQMVRGDSNEQQKLYWSQAIGLDVTDGVERIS